jgi:hypothetical protein
MVFFFFPGKQQPSGFAMTRDGTGYRELILIENGKRVPAGV